ncbi:MAG: DUF922 domain-containing protein [Bacteroidota bacterium]
MDSRLIIILLIPLASGVGFGQEIVESFAWDASRKLAWADFRGPIPPDAVPAATTASGISYEYSANLIHHEVKLDFKVTAFFYPNESWYKPEVCDEHILQHEQLHFDISEVFARRMRMKLRNTSFTANVKSEIRKIYRETLEALEEFQDKYDWETNFSRNPEAQARWNTQIKEALERLPK